jgi:ferric-dicitrate binding protein FerR (iron transport regulator)
MMTQTKDNNQLPDYILDLLLLQQQNQLSSQQVKELDEYFQNNPESKFLMEIVSKSTMLLELEQIDAEKAAQKLPPLQKAKTFKLYRQIAAWAAIVVIFLSISWFAYDSLKEESMEVKSQVAEDSPEIQQKAILKLGDGRSISLDNEQNKQIDEGLVHIENKPGEKLTYNFSDNLNQLASNHTLIVPSGARYELTLADGTKVWMNAESELVYPTVFNTNERRVQLKGEAFFEVTKNPDQPFIVEAEGNEIRVLGTSFNISAYDNDPSFQATLVSGKVNLKTENGESVSLEPGQLAEVNQTSHEVLLKKVDTKLYTSWRDDILYFKDIEMSALMNKLERWYGVDIQIMNPDKEKIRFSGAMENQKDLDFILHLIAQTTSIKIEKQEDKILIY